MPLTKRQKQGAAARQSQLAKKRKSEIGEFFFLHQIFFDKNCLELMNQNLGVGSMDLTDKDGDSSGKVWNKGLR